jgi:hypothetical protein
MIGSPEEHHTDAQRKQVEALAGFGISEAAIKVRLSVGLVPIGRIVAIRLMAG